MVIDWSQTAGSVSQGIQRGKVHAAAYVRMSTEHQKYSTDNQLAAIRVYVG